ncbi:MAG: type II secretion system protein [Phycisphaerae bacterium]|jgi:prepilin-type N-terminal cleavage/methylation domain-containing protein|nr:type II secretion system protein [Phycisphaerae bacterium]
MTRKTITSRFRPPSTATRNRLAGFTLVELLAVMLILAILTGLVGGAVWRLFPDVNETKTKNTMAVVTSAITEYHNATGDYPSQADWVGQLADTEESRKQIEKLAENVWSATNNNEFRDAWGNAIAYSPTGGPAGAPGLTSAGPDGDISTEEDNVRHNK